MIKAEQLSTRLGSQQVLENIDLEVAPGEIIALLGPSGCGKTTLLRSLALLTPPNSGRLRIGDKLFQFPDRAPSPWQTIYPQLTVVFQQFPLWPHLTVRRNLLLPLELQGRGGEGKKVNEMSEELALSVYLDRFPSQLSVGQRQRVAFLRALLLNPRYLLLDEITAAQDVEHIKRMMQAIRKMAANGTSVILATHLIRFAHHLATRFYFIDHGRVVEEGKVERLKSAQSDRLKDFLLVGDEL